MSLLNPHTSKVCKKLKNISCIKNDEAFIGIYTLFKKMAYNPPTLYAKSSTGKSMQWSIEVEETMGGGLIRTRHGYEGGKIQVNEKTITVGKNIGKANATTPLQQAIAEATRQRE